MWCGAGVITRAILVSCMLCSKALSPSFPLSHPAPTANSDYVSLNSQFDSSRIDWKKPEPESLLWLLMWQVTIPASHVSHMDISKQAKNQAKECCSVSSQRALWCALVLSDSSQGVERNILLGLWQALMGWLLEMMDGSCTSAFLRAPRQQNILTVTAAGMRLLLLLPWSCMLICFWIQCSSFSCFNH